VHRFHDIRIKRKLTLIIVAVMTVSFAISALVAGIYRYRTDRAAVEHHLGVLASAIGANCSAALVFKDERAALEVLSALQSDHSITCAVLTDERSMQLASFGTCGSGHDAQTGAKPERGELRVDQRIVVDAKTVGYLTIWGRTSDINERMAKEAVISITAFVVAVLFILMVFERMLRLLNSPLAELEETIHRVVRSRNYALRAAKTSDDEIGDVVIAFNQLMEQIEESAAPATSNSSAAQPPSPADAPVPATEPAPSPATSFKS
jgi:methyl-accepting chemotaxis protein